MAEPGAACSVNAGPLRSACPHLHPQVSMELQQLLRMCPGFEQEHRGGAVSGAEQDGACRACSTPGQS